MAHKYSNFADAFAELENYWESSLSFYNSAETQRMLAFTAWMASDDHTAIIKLITALQYTNLSIRSITQFHETDPGQSELMESIYWAAQGGGGGEVTMDAILSVMITSDFADLQKFIGLIDAYRVALWNKPFNADFYSALARGFST